MVAYEVVESVPPKKSAGASTKSKKAGISSDKENPKISKDENPKISKVKENPKISKERKEVETPKGSKAEITKKSKAETPYVYSDEPKPRINVSSRSSDYDEDLGSIMDDDEEEEEVNTKTSEDKKIELPKIFGRRTAKIKEANSQRDHQVDDLTVDEDPEVAGNVDGNPEISAVTKDPEISVDGKNPEIPVIVKDPEIAVLGENLKNPVITKDPEI